MSRLIAEGRNVGLLIAGEGHLRAPLQQQIDELQLNNHIRLVGFLNDPRELYRAIDIFVLSSLREGLPNVVLEAMASQRAVVATRVNGIPRLVTHGENGIVVETDCADALYSGIRTVMDSADTQAAIATARRQTVEQEFSFGRRMEKIAAIYRSLSGQLAQAIAPAAIAKPLHPELISH